MQTGVAILLALGLVWPALPQNSPLNSPQASRPDLTATRVVLLGTGTPYPDPAASGPATAVVVGGRVFLFDAGPGVMRRLRAANLPISGPEALFLPTCTAIIHSAMQI